MVKRVARVAAAVGIGYLLGRRRKLQLALTLGAAAAAGRLSGNSGDLLRGAGSLISSPELGKLAGLGRPLVAAGKAAAMTAVSSRIDAISDQLQDRAGTLRAARTTPPEPRSRATVRPGSDAETDEDEFDDEPYDDEEQDAPRTRRPSGERRAEEPDDDEDEFDDDDDRDEDADEDDDDDQDPDDDEDEDEPAPPASRTSSRSREAARPPVVRRRGK
ncbi:hypothetical protein [Micromonospora sp. NPDC049679]|uniref:hypothetical protein n=1 Tax=Micromonospora sp. NPDC049679 TaxID=3155920 RepID=UPI0033C33518